MTQNEKGYGKLFEQTKRQNLNQPVRPDADRDERPSDETAQESEAFSLISSQRQQKLMVEFRFKTGNARALAYSYLVGIEFDPSTGIKMDFSGYEVQIVGRNLAPWFAGLVAQRVAAVTETDELQAEAKLPSDATVVTEIKITEPK